MSNLNELPRKQSYTRANLSVLRCASKDETRYNLMSVAFDPNGTTIATDGHTMAVYTPAGVDTPPRPDKEGGPIAVELECVKAIHKTIGAHGDFMWADDEIGGTIASTSKCIKLPTVTPNRGSTEMSFPAWTHVLPSPKEPITARIDARYLKRIAEAAIEASGLSCRDSVPVDITIDKDEPYSPVSFEHETEEGAKFHGIVMPMRK